jgi:hypothetical protein
MPCVKGKRKPYQRRFYKPRFGSGAKTTTKEGYNAYMKDYMAQLRALKKKEKKK